jgi:hypothetical protein
MRGVYRHFEEVGGRDIWRARVEVSRSEWIDIEHAVYYRDGLQPPFWNLPLEQDYIESVSRDPLFDIEDRFYENVVYPGILIAMGLGAVIVVVMLAWFAIFARLG